MGFQDWMVRGPPTCMKLYPGLVKAWFRCTKHTPNEAQMVKVLSHLKLRYLKIDLVHTSMVWESTFMMLGSTSLTC